MALIRCSNCGKEISDKAKECPHCGQVISLETFDNYYVPVICEECGYEIPFGMDSCPNCGCPVSVEDTHYDDTPQKVELTSVNLPRIKKKTRSYLIIGVIAIVVVIIAVFAGSYIHQRNEEAEAARISEEYGENLETASHTMLLGAAEAEDAGNLIRSVWYNSIHEERDSVTDKYTRPNGYFVSDFNVAIANLLSDSDFQATISSIRANQDTVADLMRALTNPPEEYEEAYSAIRDLYAAYTDLTNLATNPTGSLMTYTQNFNDADSEVANCYDAMGIYID